jgi:predicted ATP-grasp superfamily ATP-dependent carboligase
VTARRPTVLVAGVSARALARSARWAGYAVAAVDGFGDRDLVEHVARHELVQPFRARRAALRAAAIPADAVAYASTFENHPIAVACLAAGRALWGNAPATLAEVRRPERVTAVLRAAGLPAPMLEHESTDRTRTPWLVKPRRGGGGRGIRAWRPGERVRRHEYLQERIDGVSGSLVFLADGRAFVPLALTRQLTGDARFGGRDHGYTGSLLASRRAPAFEAQDALFESAWRGAAVLVATLGLRGLGTLDFVARDGVAWPVEVNPRHSASVELIERALDASLFPHHVDAGHGTLPAGMHDPLGWHDVPGKAVLYARRPLTMTGSDELLAAGDVADIGADGTPIPEGAPVCTVFARGGTPDECMAALVRRATAILPQPGERSEAA